MKISIKSKVKKVEELSSGVFIMTMNFPEKPLPGQFVMIGFDDTADGPYLPRPISVYDWKEGVLFLLVKEVGRGTLMMKNSEGKTLRVTGPLGSSFPDVSGCLLCVGGGIGIAPLHYALKESSAEKRSSVLGFTCADSVFCVDDFEKNSSVMITTDDGSRAFKGNPAVLCENMFLSGADDIMPDAVFCCGPEIMMKKINSVFEGKVPVWHSLEARMACGTGVCLGCRRKIGNESVLVCSDGPVFSGEKIFREV